MAAANRASPSGPVPRWRPRPSSRTTNGCAKPRTDRSLPVCLPFAAVGPRTHFRRPPRSSDGERPTAIRVNHEVERSARVVVGQALILSTVLGDALVPRRDLTIRQLLDGQEEVALIKLWVLAAEARRAVRRPPEIPVTVHCENFRRLTAWS